MPNEPSPDPVHAVPAARPRLWHSRPFRYALAAFLACAAAALEFGFQRLIGPGQEAGSYQFFLGATALSSVWSGRVSGFITLGCSALFKLYLFLPPYNSFRVETPATPLLLLLFLSIGSVICLGGGALYKSREMFSRTLGSIGDAVVATDGKKLVRYMNPVAQNLSGWSGGTALGRTVHDVLHVVDEHTSARTELPFDATLREGLIGHISNSSVLVSKTGERVPIEDTISPILGNSQEPQGAIMVFRNVTEQRVTENALRESETRYRFLADAVPEFIFTTGADGRWDYCNRRWYEYTGLGAAEPMGEMWASVLHPDDAQQAVDKWAESVQTGHVYEAEYRIRSSQGNYRWFLSRGFPMPDRHGRIRRWFGVCTDIDDLKRTQEQLSQSRKMEAVGRLAGGVAHDFNNLLTVIIGYGKILADAAEIEGTPSVPAQQIVFAAERAGELTRQLLTFSRQQIVQPRLLNLNSVIREIESLLRRLIGENISVRVILDPDLLPVRIDRSQMDQVIVNLAVNARDAMPSGGHLTIETANMDLDQPYTRDHLTVEPGRYVVLAVSDTGVGMDRETASHIFEPFFTTKAVGKGTGLGLSVVYGIIKQHGGHIWAYSEPGKGATFKVYLPAVAEADIDIPRTAAATRRDTRGTETVMVLEDEPMVRKLVQTVLGQKGYTVLAADSPEEALILSEQHAGPIHLLVTDVVMPGMSGTQVAHRLLQSHPGLKVLYMSGYTPDAIARHGVLDSGVAFLQKPFSADSLAHKVRDTLDN